jgi:hypothetical protein
MGGIIMKSTNKFKTMALVLISILVLIISSFSAIGADPNLASFEVFLLTYEPSPAEPGSYLDVTFSATNIGKQAASNAKFELIEEYPFSLDSSQDAIKELGPVGSKQDLVLKYKVRVDSQAVLGLTPLKIRYTTNGNNWLTSEFNVDVRTSEAILVIDSIESPDTMIPGETSKVDITLNNLASATLKDVTLKLDLASTTATLATDVITIDQPFVPIGSGMEQKEKFLAAGAKKTFSYNLRTYADAESKIYKIPMVITYKDESGTEYTKSEILGLVVGSQPRLSIEADASGLHAMNGYGDVTFKIINKGFTDVKFLTATLVESSDYQGDSHSKDVYVGTINSDDYESVDYHVKALANDVTFKLMLEYTDANNRPFTETIDIPVNISSQSKNQKSSTPWGLIVLVVAGVGGFFWWKKHKKKKKD